ncbi:MAG: SnoaL-like domain-containing protein [Tabrizicola sp.]|nr:SnoaL-like domain-containing protein [Tabrizicola sp.]
MKKKDCTVAIQQSIETRLKAPLVYFDSRKYIQHNVNLGDGLGPILQFMDSMPAEGTKVMMRRAFEDGDMSFAHADYILGEWGPMTGFEVHRWEDGKIVEHWDNLQATPDTPNASGRTLTDGATDVTDPGATAASKALVNRYVDEILIGGDHARLAEFLKNDLIQHTPTFGDGAAAVSEYLSSEDAARYVTRHRTMAEGEFVLTICEGTLGGTPVAIYDLHRIEGGQIAEHWDVIEPIPPRKLWKNDNGKF